MNALKAAQETIELWQTSKILKPELIYPATSSLALPHCHAMLEEMSTPTFSYGKQCRWLGWIQACCVAQTEFTLEDMKEINRRNK